MSKREPRRGVDVNGRNDMSYVIRFRKVGLLLILVFGMIMLSTVSANSTCSAGGCNQHGLSSPSCGGGGCIQSCATNPRCEGGRCDQTNTTDSSCKGNSCYKRDLDWKCNNNCQIKECKECSKKIP